MPGTKIAESLRREQIITAAYQLASRGGLRTVTIRNVAKKAEMSTGLVVFHFRTKERVLLALLDHVLASSAFRHPRVRGASLFRHPERERRTSCRSNLPSLPAGNLP